MISNQIFGAFDLQILQLLRLPEIFDIDIG
jgi:hypothetical protein